MIVLLKTCCFALHATHLHDDMHGNGELMDGQLAVFVHITELPHSGQLVLGETRLAEELNSLDTWDRGKRERESEGVGRLSIVRE